MRLVDQFNGIAHRLPQEWADARFVLSVADAGRCDRAAALLGPANPGRTRNNIIFTVARRGGGIGPEAARRLLKRLDNEGVTAKLALIESESAPAAELRVRPSLRDGWDSALASLPPDWSDLYAEVRLDSTDFLERAALLLAPANPSRPGDRAALSFRSARSFGYGVSPEMAGRCLERCDEEGITGEVEVLHALSDTHPVGTQGPVWVIGGRAV